MINPFNKKKSTFPFLPQTGMMECGTTCLAMILKYYGFYNVQRFLAQAARVNTEGTNMYVLSQLATSFGFVSDGYEMEYKYLQEITLPCIAHYEGVHFIVIIKANAEFVWVADPAYGKDKYTKEEFEKRWNGLILTIEPTEKMFKDRDLLEYVEEYRKKQASVFSKFYSRTLKPRRKLLFQILILTLLLQIAGLAMPIFTQTIVDNVLLHDNKRLLFSILFAMIIVFFIQVVFLHIRNLLLVQYKIFIEHDFFSKYFKHFISLFQSYFDRHKREDFINRFQENVRIRNLLKPGLLQSFIDLVFVLGYIPLLFFYKIKLGVLAVILSLLFIIIAIGLTPKIRSLVNKVFYKNISVLGKFTDILLGINTVKLLGVEQIKFMSWQNEYKKGLNTAIDSEKVQVAFLTLQRTAFLASQVTMFWIGAYWVFINELTLGQYLATITIFNIVLNSLNNISTLLLQVTELSVSMARLNDVLVQDSEIIHTSTVQHIPSTIENITIENLNFGYNNIDKNLVLKNINLRINKGEKIGLVGRNGAGKTTLVKLLVNLYPTYSGKISINSKVNLLKLNPQLLRKKIFLFPQDIYIFNASIRENILYANPNASNDEIIKAAKKADLHDFVKTLHLGYNHKVGNNGANLSGGQILKIGFARLFISAPDIIILDEASSQLDVETEERILKNIHDSFKQKIIITIAHRINTLKQSDKIVVLDEGELIEEGTHAELLELKGIYYKFLKTYVSY